MSETEEVRRRADRLEYVVAREHQLQEGLAALNLELRAAGNPSSWNQLPQSERLARRAQVRSAKLQKAEKHRELARLARERSALRLTPGERTLLSSDEARENVGRWIKEL